MDPKLLSFYGMKISEQKPREESKEVDIETEEKDEMKFDTMETTVDINSEEVEESKGEEKEEIKEDEVKEEMKEEATVADEVTVAEPKVEEVTVVEPKVEETKDDSEMGPSEEKEGQSNIMKKAKKAAVAVAGGALIVAGIPLIPLGPTGEFMMVGGLALLATEFPAAQRVLDKGKDKLKEFAENGSEDDESAKDDDDSDYEIVDANDSQGVASVKKEGKTNSTQYLRKAKKSLRSFTKGTILPIFDHMAPEKDGNKKEQEMQTM